MRQENTSGDKKGRRCRSQEERPAPSSYGAVAFMQWTMVCLRVLLPGKTEEKDQKARQQEVDDTRRNWSKVRILQTADEIINQKLSDPEIAKEQVRTHADMNGVDTDESRLCHKHL